MAIYRFSASLISRSSGRSVVAAAAYRAGVRLYDDRIPKWFDYTRKPVAHREVMAPHDAPHWAKDRQLLWTRVEQVEKRKDAQLAREIQLALPIELSHEEQLNLLRNYLQEQFVYRGMVADFAVHREDENNPHTHVLLTLREIGPDGFGPKERSWNSNNLLLRWRKQWAIHANRALGQQVLTSGRKDSSD